MKLFESDPDGLMMHKSKVLNSETEISTLFNLLDFVQEEEVVWLKPIVH